MQNTELYNENGVIEKFSENEYWICREYRLERCLHNAWKSNAWALLCGVGLTGLGLVTREPVAAGMMATYATVFYGLGCGFSSEAKEIKHELDNRPS